MDNENPYQPPPAVQDDDSKELDSNLFESMLGFEFESDWSTAGIRLRRRNSLHGSADIGFVLLTATWIGTILLATMIHRFGGLACLLTPIWIIAGMLWISSLIFRHAGTFANACRGLLGPVRGRVDEGYISIVGPALSLVARVQDCRQSHWCRRGAVFRPPLITESLPVIESDIRQTWATKNQLSEKGSSDELLRRMCGEPDAQDNQDRVLVAGELKGSDLRGQRCWWTWLLAGVSLCIFGLLAIAWGIYKYVNLPPWILNPPSHYIPGDADQSLLGNMILISVIGVVLLAIGIWQWTRTLATFGEYRVAISANRVVIATDQVALGYHGEALQHFTGCEKGVAVRGGKGKLFFLIPSRWFQAADHDRINAWFSSGSNRKALTKSTYYVGPKV